jgi:hypothetical protein
MTGSLDSPPASPPASSGMSSLGWGTKPDNGLGPEASNPQVKALQAIKMIEMGAQMLSTSLPELAGPVQSFVQQLSQLVPQMMSQQMAGGPTGMGAPSPVPTPQGGGVV